jgi:hypothetical protein
MDPAAATEIELRLASYGLDAHSINVEVYAQVRELFLMFETLLVSAQSRRTVSLREINNQRHAKELSKGPGTRRLLSRSTSLSGSTLA